MHVVGLKDPNRVIEIRDNLQEIIKLFDAVLDNKVTMKSVSEYFGITPQKMNIAINNKLRPYFKQQFETLQPEDMIKIVEFAQPPAYFILKDAYIKSEHEPKCIEFPEYDENAIYDILKNTIYEKEDINAERNHNIICSYYGINCEKKTMEELGNMYGITRSRVDQIIDKTIYVLKKPESIRQIFKLPKMNDYSKQLNIIQNEENNLKAQYHDAYFKYKALKESLKVLDLYDQVQQEILSKYPELEDQDLIDNSLKMATPIEQLDLSIRLYNVLKYNNLRTIKQIYESDFKTIFSLRNLGRKSLLELIDKLNELDCINPAWKTDMQKYMQKL